MSTLRAPGGPRAATRSAIDPHPHEFRQDRAGPLDGELLDLYVAILIAVPIAFLLKAWWF